jgi:hypothetical protein
MREKVMKFQRRGNRELTNSAPQDFLRGTSWNEEQADRRTSGQADRRTGETEPVFHFSLFNFHSPLFTLIRSSLFHSALSVEYLSDERKSDEIPAKRE